MRYVIVLLGLIRFFGDTFQISALDKIGFVSGFSPLPLVFSDREGVEDFAHKINIKYTVSNKFYESAFDQNAYSQIEGPLLRVGVYSIALAYSPRFSKALWENTLRYGFCHNGPLANSIKAQGNIENVNIEISHLLEADKKWLLDFSCLN